MNGSADALLLRSYIEAQSQDAFSTLVERHLNMVYSAALRRVGGDLHLAEDVTQQVFVALARNARRLSLHPVLSAWLFTTTRNVAAQLVRKERRRKSLEAACPPPDGTHPVSEDADWEQISPILDELIDELSEQDRRAVLLRFAEHRRYSEIGAALHLSDDAARMRVDRALAKLRSLLARRGIKSPSAGLAALLIQQTVSASPATLSANVVASGVFSTGAASGILTFMSITKVTAWTAGIVVILTAGTVLHTSRVVAAAKEGVVIAERERDQARAEVSELRRKLAHGETRNGKSITIESLAPSGIPSSSPVSATKPVAFATIGMQTSNPLRALWGLRSSPEAMRAWIEAQRSGLQLQLGPLFKRLNLSASDTERFKAISMAKFQTIADVAEAAASQGVEASDPVVKELIGEANLKTENTLHALLGDVGYKELRDYGETMGLREVVTSLAGHAYFTDNPLTSVQSERLVQIIAAETVKESSRYDLQTTNWQKVFENAKGILSSEQIDLLRAERDQINLRNRLIELEKKQVNTAAR